MTDRLVSPTLVGRDREMDAIENRLRGTAAGDPAVVLVGGEAGVGKSRLVEEVTRLAAAEGGRVLVGRCVPLGGDGLPFAPLVDALRELVRTTPPDELDDLIGPARGELARLLPELEPAASTDVVPAGTGAASRLFELVLGVVRRLAAGRPFVLVVEDLHWADRSTIDLVAFMSSALRSDRVLLIATYRSDELHRDHPLTRVLAELERLRTVTVISLDRFGRSEVAEQLRGILGQEPAADLVDRVFKRSEGNAFLVEEVLGAVERGSSDVLVSSLGHLLLARVRSLGRETQELLGVVAMAGRPVGHSLLAAVTGLPAMDLAGRLREAVDHHVLVVEPTNQAYTFRHALLRDAVYQDTLPGERVLWHSAYGDALERDRTLGGGIAVGASELAYHRYAALDLARALPAAVDAARQAAAVFGYTEALRLLERALELWPQVAGAEATTGVDHLGLLELTADVALTAGDGGRALRIVDAALAEVDRDAEPERVALLLNRRALANRAIGANPVVDLDKALILLSRERPSLALAVVLESLARVYIVTGDFTRAAAEATAEEALAVARAVGAREQEANALTSLGGMKGYLGNPDEAVELVRQGLALSIEIGAWESAQRAYTNLSDTLLGAGRYQEAADAATAGLELARQLGLEGSFGGAIDAFNLGLALKSLGRWDEAELVVNDVLALKPTGMAASFAHMDKAVLAAARGQYDEAQVHLDACLANAGDDPEPQLALDMVAAQLDVAAGRRQWDTAVTLLSDTLRRGAVIGIDRYIWPLMASGLRALADAAEEARRHRREPDPTLLALASDIAALADRLRPAPHPLHGFEALVAAESGRLGGSRSPGPWAQAASAWRAIGMPHPLAYALLRLGEAQLAAGDRPGGAESLAEAAAISERLGAQPLLAAALALTRAARLDAKPVAGLQDDALARPGGDPSPSGLTAREVDVLRLIAAGRTNGEIAAELYISPKTASVHVSNILAKLNVSNRVEAAAVAHRAGLVGT